MLPSGSGFILAERHFASPQSPLEQARRNRSKLRSKISSAQMHTVATLHAYGTRQLLVERGEASRRCKQLTIARVRSPHGPPERGVVISGCGLPLGPGDLNIGPAQIGPAPDGLLLHWGPVGTRIDSLELRFEDGSRVAIPIHAGYILYQVSPHNYASGHRPTEVVARNAAGQIVKVRKFGFLP
jgi:hypothetical protein